MTHACKSFARGAQVRYSKHCFESFSELLQCISRSDREKLSYRCSCCKKKVTPYFEKLIQDGILCSGNVQSAIPAPMGAQVPTQSEVSPGKVFVRDSSVVAWVLDQAKGRCECCGTSHTFLTDSGQMYLEVHHVVPLAEGGPDTPQNAVAVCPTCHRALHYASDRQERREKLYGSLERLRRPQRR